MIYVACPANVVTGGPTLSHQMCYELNQLGCEARMFYYGQNKKIEIWEGIEDSPYAKYGVKPAESIEEIDKKENTVIIPEMAVPLKDMFSEALVHIWWMSVDGYLVSLVNGVETLQTDIAYFKRENVLHFVQSRYAYDFLSGDIQIPQERIMYLTDYIDEKYLGEEKYSGEDRKDVVYYNYTKCGQELPVIMENYPDIEWIPIRNMTMDQIIDAFHHGKVYIDFGMHPGKDRLPREAASCGLCIITNKKGSAANDEDVPIDAVFKFEDPIGQMEDIIGRIRECFSGYEERVNDFAAYREWIRGERKRFQEEVKVVKDRLERS